jgi:hypothetical protein
VQVWTAPAVTNLFNNSSSVKRALGELLGSEGAVPYLFGGQVALRYPGTLCMPGTYEPVPAWKTGFCQQICSMTLIKAFSIQHGTLTAYHPKTAVFLRVPLEISLSSWEYVCKMLIPIWPALWLFIPDHTT